jgi:hypothetical protein
MIDILRILKRGHPRNTKTNQSLTIARHFFLAAQVMALWLLSPNSAQADTPRTSPQSVSFNRQNCKIDREPIPVGANARHYRLAYGLRLFVEDISHKWNGRGSAFRVRGACQSHVIWSDSEVIGFDNGQFVNYYNEQSEEDFTPSPYTHAQRFSDFAGAPALFGQTPVYFVKFQDQSIGVWRSGNSWIVNSVKTADGLGRSNVSRRATSIRPIISALDHPLYHSPSYDLGIVQVQPDGSRIVFSFRFDPK